MCGLEQKFNFFTGEKGPHFVYIEKLFFPKSKSLLWNCPNDEGREKWTLEFTLVDFLDTTEEELHTAGHVSGPKCTCSVCDSLKRLEDKFILRTGSFYSNGLNSRNEITRKARCSW